MKQHAKNPKLKEVDDEYCIEVIFYCEDVTVYGKLVNSNITLRRAA